MKTFGGVRLAHQGSTGHKGCIGKRAWKAKVELSSKSKANSKLHRVTMKNIKGEKDADKDKIVVGNVINERYLACGSFGKIFSATVRFPCCDMPIAIKKIPLAQTAKANALREAEILRRVCHANIVTIYDIIKHQPEREIWIVTEYMRGGSLRTYCTGDRLMDFRDKLKVSYDCWSALSYLHEDAKITHKDIKPENILLHHLPKGDVIAKLCDFGLAKITDTLTRTEPTSITGTAMYFPPEYVEGIRNAEKADVYSMGASLCELYGQCYFWCQEGTDVPLSYPQIIGKLISIWNNLKKGIVNECHSPMALRTPSSRWTSRVRKLLSSAVRHDRHYRPSAIAMKESFATLWIKEKRQSTKQVE